MCDPRDPIKECEHLNSNVLINFLLDKDANPILGELLLGLSMVNGEGTETPLPCSSRYSTSSGPQKSLGWL